MRNKIGFTVLLTIMVLMASGQVRFIGKEQSAMSAAFATIGQFDSNYVKDGSLSWSDMPTTVTPFAKTFFDDAAGVNVRATIGAGTGSGDMMGAAFRDSLNAVVDYQNVADSSFIAYDPPLLLQAGMAIKFGDIVYQNKVSKKLYTAMGDSLISVDGLYICILRGGGAADAWVTVMTAGVVKFTPWTGVTTDSTWVYVSPSAAGAPTMVRPSTTGQWSVKAGRALTTDVLLFKPDDTQLLVP